MNGFTVPTMQNTWKCIWKVLNCSQWIVTVKTFMYLVIANPPSKVSLPSMQHPACKFIEFYPYHGCCGSCRDGQLCWAKLCPTAGGGGSWHKDESFISVELSIITNYIITAHVIYLGLAEGNVSKGEAISHCFCYLLNTHKTTSFSFFYQWTNFKWECLIFTHRYLTWLLCSVSLWV